MTIKIIIALAALLAIVAWEWRRWPLRKKEKADAAALEADANAALKAIAKLGRERARSRSIPVPIAPEDTTDVIALHPHRRTGDQAEHAHVRKPQPRPSQYQIVAQRSRPR
jgi:C4-dicarboxylate-specific signal transduction histidine kinase